MQNYLRNMRIIIPFIVGYVKVISGIYKVFSLWGGEAPLCAGFQTTYSLGCASCIIIHSNNAALREDFKKSMVQLLTRKRKMRYNNVDASMCRHFVRLCGGDAP